MHFSLNVKKYELLLSCAHGTELREYYYSRFPNEYKINDV